MCLNSLSSPCNLTNGRNYPNHVKVWQVKGLIKSIEMDERAYSNNNRFFGLGEITQTM